MKILCSNRSYSNFDEDTSPLDTQNTFTGTYKDPLLEFEHDKLVSMYF